MAASTNEAAMWFPLQSRVTVRPARKKSLKLWRINNARRVSFVNSRPLSASPDVTAARERGDILSLFPDLSQKED